MLKSFHYIFTALTDDILIISTSLLIIVFALIIIYWRYNRKKFHALSHEIPAGVVKNYLDSIIQNSNALKSSLFRGGGLDLGEGTPSVVPVKELSRGSSVGVSGVSSEELNQKNAEIASLNSRMNQKNDMIRDLESKIVRLEGDIKSLAAGSGSGEQITRLQGEVSALQAKLKAAEEALAAAANSPASGTGGSLETEAKLQAVTKERDELKERLMEYEIIEEDLANLKRLQQENQQLKKSLEALQGGAPVGLSAAPITATAPVAAAQATPAAQKTVAPEPEAVPIEDPIATEEVDFEAEMAKAIQDSKPAKKETAPETTPEPEIDLAAAANNSESDGDGAGAPSVVDVPPNEGEQKSAEELLSEFEKMLG